MKKVKELFHTYENEDMTINCYYLPDEPSDQNHEVECIYKSGAETQCLTTNCRQACVALCVEIDENYKV